jgi:hypothetical protein
VKLNIFRKFREEVNQPEHESDKEKDIVALKATLSPVERTELRDQLISLMVLIIKWEEFPSLRKSEWASSIVKGRNIIEYLQLEHPSLNKSYINSIWGVCFKKAKELARAEIGSKKAKNERVGKLSPKDVFECDYSLPWQRNNDLPGAHIGKKLSESAPLLAILFIVAGSLANLGSNILSFKALAILFFAVSFSIIFSVVIVGLLPRFILMPLAVGASMLFGLQLVQPATPTAPQSSTPVKPSPSPKPGFTEPLKNSQSVHQKEIR